MKILILSLFLSLSAFAENRTKVAVIDTGVSYYQKNKKYICKNGAKSYIGKDSIDHHGHGTNIISIISPSINSKTHCIVSYKVWHSKASEKDSLEASVKALEDIIKDTSIRYINISMGGVDKDFREKNLIRRLLLRGVVIVVAAGNKSKNLDKKCVFYPACYRQDLKYNNFRVVESGLKSSNRGSFTTDRLSGYKVGSPAMSGTSQATAQKMSQILKSMVYNSRRLNDGLQSSDTNNRGKRNFR